MSSVKSLSSIWQVFSTVRPHVDIGLIAGHTDDSVTVEIVLMTDAMLLHTSIAGESAERGMHQPRLQAIKLQQARNSVIL